MVQKSIQYSLFIPLLIRCIEKKKKKRKKEQKNKRKKNTLATIHVVVCTRNLQTETNQETYNIRKFENVVQRKQEPSMLSRRIHASKLVFTRYRTQEDLRAFQEEILLYLNEGWFLHGEVRIEHVPYTRYSQMLVQFVSV